MVGWWLEILIMISGQHNLVGVGAELGNICDHEYFREIAIAIVT